MENKIWYPGSAFANLNWIEYLQKKYVGNWFFSDTSNFDNWDSIKGKKICLNTINESIDQFLNFDILVISRHPKLRDVEDLLVSGILNLIRLIL